MVTALKWDLTPAYQAQEEMLEKDETFDQENMRLQRENLLLQQENVRLQVEINDMKWVFANQERQLTTATYRIRELRLQLSSMSFGSVVFTIGLIVAIVLFIYGMGFIDFSISSMVDDYLFPVIEN